MKTVIVNKQTLETIEFQREKLTAFDIEEQIYCFWMLEPASDNWEEELFLNQRTLFYKKGYCYLVSIKKDGNEIRIDID